MLFCLQNFDHKRHKMLCKTFRARMSRHRFSSSSGSSSSGGGGGCGTASHATAASNAGDEPMDCAPAPTVDASARVNCAAALRSLPKSASTSALSIASSSTASSGERAAPLTAANGDKNASFLAGISDASSSLPHSATRPNTGLRSAGHRFVSQPTAIAATSDARSVDSAVDMADEGEECDVEETMGGRGGACAPHHRQSSLASRHTRKRPFVDLTSASGGGYGGDGGDFRAPPFDEPIDELLPHGFKDHAKNTVFRVCKPNEKYSRTQPQFSDDASRAREPSV